MKNLLIVVLMAAVCVAGCNREVISTGTLTVGDPTSEMVEIVLPAEGPNDYVTFWVDTNGLLNIELGDVTLTEGATLFIREVGRQTGNAVRFVTTVAATTTTTTTLPVVTLMVEDDDTPMQLPIKMAVDTWTKTNDLQRIARSLERIADALEARGTDHWTPPPPYPQLRIGTNEIPLFDGNWVTNLLLIPRISRQTIDCNATTQGDPQ